MGERKLGKGKGERKRRKEKGENKIRAIKREMKRKTKISEDEIRRMVDI